MGEIWTFDRILARPFRKLPRQDIDFFDPINFNIQNTLKRTHEEYILALQTHL
jgi:hypothetical protein